jgi:HEAT repeat protein
MVEEQEVESVRRLMALLEKTFKTSRAYGPTHHLPQQFMQQLYETLAAHLEVHGTLSLVVQRFEFYYRDEMVYRKAAQNENLAFKLYGAGIRELSFSHGLSQETLSSFLETLGAAYDMTTSDDDVITRLWEKNLSAVSIVTAEEIVKNEDAARALIPQDSGTLNTPPSRLSAITKAEAARQADERRAGGPPTDASNDSRDSSVQTISAAETTQQAREATGGEVEGAVYSPLDLPAFEVSPEELEQLALQIKAESHQDTPTYLLDMLKVIVASEKSADVLFELRGLFREIFKSLIDEGNWKQLNSVVDRLREVHRRRDLAEEQKKAVSDMLDSLHGPKQMDAVASHLNADPHVATEDLLVFFLHLPPNAVPSLCKLLGDLKFDAHRLTLCDVLAALAKDKPEALIKGLTDSRWSYVRNLLVVIGKLRNPRLAQSVQPLAAHPDAGVRREALKTLSMLGGGTGMGNPIVGVLIDPDEGIRRSALSLLKTGKYTTPFSAWTPVVTHKEFLNRPLSELRTTFEVMTRLVGAECVPYCHHLLTQRLWTHRKTKQSLGALAAEALGQIGTPEAISALEAGKKRFNRVIRHASVTALATLKRRDL